MAATTLFRRGSISVIDYRCSVGPADAPFVERHGDFSLSYVRNGSFGCRARGESFELVAGSLLVGRPGDEYMCTHDHVFGDECLSFQLAPALVETIGGGSEIWRSGGVPPLPELMVVGELAPRAGAAHGQAKARSGNGRFDRSRDKRLDAPHGGAGRHPKDLATALEMNCGAQFGESLTLPGSLAILAQTATRREPSRYNLSIRPPRFIERWQ